MFDQVDNRLSEWVGTVLGNISVSFTAPGQMDSGGGVNLYLLELVASPPLRSQKRPPYQLALRYLVTIWDETPAGMHQALGHLAFAAMQEPEMELHLEPLSGETWTALGVAPRPAFVVQVVVQLPRPEKPPQPVLKPLRIEHVLLAGLRGSVLGPEEMPIVNGLVEIPKYDLQTRTDQDGNFVFAAIPAGRAFKRVIVRAKGYVQEYEIDPPTDGSPLNLYFNPFDKVT